MNQETNLEQFLVAGRARRACVRCKRQKLKVRAGQVGMRSQINPELQCDNQRPCYLCIRSNMECRDEERK
jgi:hypothetical protein